MDRLDAKAIKTYKEIILILDQCIDDYLFVMDLDKDIYFISPHAMKRFNIPSYEFSNSLPAHKKFVYEDDLEMLLSDMNKLVSGKKNFHNLQYRWIEKTVFLFGSIVEVNRLRIMMGMLNILLAVLMKLVKDKLLIMIVGY